MAERLVLIALVILVYKVHGYIVPEQKHLKRIIEVVLLQGVKICVIIAAKADNVGIKLKNSIGIS